MVKLTDEMKEVFLKNMEILHAVPMATASSKGIPNVAPMASVWLKDDDETFWICDNFMVKTLQNLKENPNVALYFWNPETKRCLQVKGNVEIKTEGSEYEEMYKQVKETKPQFPAKSLIVLNSTEVFECTPGSVAGNKVL
ncbi:pyridoxamine 5-phosphate oxidase [Methanoplanus sp. FWC-SCC4]|uniref:Pyridoxamine 5-phosphate oxidase n=1 Tax=Methanochimaera problematica TaxID=2609417 RepID=A0AA97FCS1_9EURY|nr:pyridoxamine 5'-phosphate oxidase family protein [Methanoplanus sp. FWC-SCC4]WOF16142.1 pyridoxamine 5-phosphate oxidase [Methanoplanus sp. FWC-SCC4]